jgi:hypothetical protein
MPGAAAQSFRRGPEHQHTNGGGRIDDMLASR